jgi:hypothetical protein
LVSINKTRGVNMAGYDPAKAARMNALAQQYPKADLGVLADLARIDRGDLGNYTTDSVGTRAVNANFGRVTSEASQTVQSTDTPRNSAGSGSAFAGNTIPAPTVTSPASSETVTNTTGSGSAFQGGGTIASQAFGDRTPAPVPSPPVPTPRPPKVQDSDVDFTDAYGENFRQATPIPAPVVQPTDTDVDFDDAYGESFRTVTPIPPSTRRPGVEQATLPPGSRGGGDFLDDRGRAPAIEPDPFPEPPPGRPAQPISQVDDFGGTGITQVDDFGGPSRNVTPVDDFAEYQAPAQVDDFAEFQAPAQVDDFSAYSNNNFGQVDDFAEINTPAQVDDFSAYSNNDFGTEDPGLDAFGPGPAPAQVDDFADYQPPAQVDDFAEFRAPAQVDDFADYSDNNFGAQVDDFGGPTRNPAQVDDFADYSDDNFGEEDFSDFATTNSPSDVNQFGVDDFGDPEVAQFDAFGDPIRSPEEVNPFGVDDFGGPEAAQFDAFGDPILAPEDRVDNDGESLVGDDPVADIGDGAEGDGIDGVEQAAISNAQTQAINAQAMKTKAQNQQTINEMREASGVKNADGDWRVKLRLAPQADYLYKAIEPGILAPLAVTDGIIFPYTPTIDVQYRAEYNNYQPTHSNYMHYFYKGSSVQTVQLQAEFTAQDTKEAEYLLACMHFLKSASKMFYGQDAQRGSPPPLLYLTGLGEYQFNEQPCVVSEFNLNLPSDVNYIRARSRHINRDDRLQFEKPLATATTNGNFSALNRLKTAVTNALNGSPEPLQVGAKPFTPSPGKLGSKGATYVPTKMSMTINLLPIASRQQVSQQFSLKEYANGNLIKKGMW